MKNLHFLPIVALMYAANIFGQEENTDPKSSNYNVTAYITYAQSYIPAWSSLPAMPTLPAIPSYFWSEQQRILSIDEIQENIISLDEKLSQDEPTYDCFKTIHASIQDIDQQILVADQNIYKKNAEDKASTEKTHEILQKNLNNTNDPKKADWQENITNNKTSILKILTEKHQSDLDEIAATSKNLLSLRNKLQQKIDAAATLAVIDFIEHLTVNGDESHETTILNLADAYTIASLNCNSSAIAPLTSAIYHQQWPESLHDEKLIAHEKRITWNNCIYKDGSMNPNFEKNASDQAKITIALLNLFMQSSEEKKDVTVASEILKCTDDGKKIICKVMQENFKKALEEKKTAIERFGSQNNQD